MARQINCFAPFRAQSGLRAGKLTEEVMVKAQTRRILVISAAALAVGVVQSAHATDPTPKWCAGVKIAAFPGGPQGAVFANNVYNGFRQAELDLGPSVTYYFSDWDPNKLLTQVQQALATKVDGIATYGFGGEPELGETFDQTLDVKLNSAAMQPIRIAYDVRRHGVQQPVVRDSALPLTISSFQLFPSSLNECLYRRAV